jgi:hypothetical protein
MEDSFRDRESQFEAKFAHDEELKFKVEVHRNKLFAAWVADQMGDGASPEYADTLLEFAFGRKPADLVAKAQADLHAAGIALADIKLRKAFEQCEEQAIVDVAAA